MKALIALSLLAPITASAQGISYEWDDLPWLVQDAVPTDISAGNGYTCVTTDCGSLECWGDTPQGVPKHLDGDYVEVAAGYHQVCAREKSGYVDCFGANVGGGNLNPPALSFAQIEGAYAHTCGRVNVSGEIYCWGFDIEAAQGNEGAHPGSNQAGPYVDVSTSLRHTCALHDRGFVECWGSNSWNRARGLDPSETQWSASNERLLGVSTGLNHTAIRSEWMVYGMGEDAFDEVTDHNYYEPVPGEVFAPTFFDLNTSPAQVAAGAHFTCARYARSGMGRNRVYCWGDDRYGQASPPSTRFSDIAAGWWHACGITTGDAIECWGEDIGPVPDMTCDVELTIIEPKFTWGG